MGAILAYVVGTVFCIFIGLVYSELTPAIPHTGGCVVFAYKAKGYWAAVFAGLASAFSYLGIAAWEGPAFASAVNYILPLPEVGRLWTVKGHQVYLSVVAVSIVAAVIITWMNYVGAKSTAILQTAAMVGLICIGLIFLGGAVTKGDVQYMKPLFTDKKGFVMVLLMVPAMFVGFDVVPQSASEMNVPLRKIPKILIFSIIAAAMWYILMIFATCMSAPEQFRIFGDIPVADAMAFNFGSHIWGKICVVGAICGILTSWNGFLYGGARVLFSLANAKMLPGFLGKIHPVYKTPSNAVLLCGGVSIASCLLGADAVTWFVEASSFGVVLVYLSASLAFVRLRKYSPDMPRPYKVRNGKFVGGMAMTSTVMFALLYLPSGPCSLNTFEWCFVGGWFLCGFLMSWYMKKKYFCITREDREKLLL